MFVFNLQRFTMYNRGILSSEYTNSSQVDFKIRREYSDNSGTITRSTYYIQTTDDIAETPDTIDFDEYMTDERIVVSASTIDSIGQTTLEDQANLFIFNKIETELSNVVSNTGMTSSDKREEYESETVIMTYPASSISAITVNSTNLDNVSLSSIVQSYITTNVITKANTMSTNDTVNYTELLEYLDTIVTIPDLTLPNNTTENYVVRNGVAFKIDIEYSKGDAINIVYIDAYIDGVKHDSTYVEALDTVEEGDAEVARVAANIVSRIKTSCDAFPANYSSTYTKNGFSFNISLTYAKTAGQNTYTIAKAYDAHIYNTDTYTYNMSNISANTTTSLNNLKTYLDTNCPADTESVYTVGGFNWYIGTTYSKSAGNDTVTIRSKLDRSDYGIDTATFNLDAPTKATTLMATLTTALDRFPTNTDEIYTIRYMNWYISKRYSKSAGNSTITTWVVLDTHQYSDAHTETFSISAYQTVEDYNNQLVSLIKRLIVAFAPISGVHYTQPDPHYPAGVMTHVIDIDYYKEAGSEDMVVKFTMDNKTIRGYSDPIPVDVNTFTSADITNATNEVLTAALSQSNNTGFMANAQTLVNLLNIQSITA